MNRALCTVGVIAVTATSYAGLQYGTASVSVDVLTVNGSPQGTVGVVDAIGVQSGDVIQFGVYGTLNGDDAIMDPLFISDVVLRFAPVGAFGTVDPNSIMLNDSLGDFAPGDRVTDDNGVNVTSISFFGGDEDVGTSGQLFTFEFVVDATTGSFAYDQLVTPAPGEPQNRLVASVLGGSVSQNDDVPITSLQGDLIIVPAPGAALMMGVAGVAGLARRRR